MAGITRLGAYGGPRSLYGSFAGKVGGEAPVVSDTVQFGKTFYAGYEGNARRRNAIAASIAREDEEILAIVQIIGKYLL